MKKIIMTIGAIALLATGLHANQFPKGSFENEMLLTVDGMKANTYKENLRLCEIFVKKSKEFDLSDKNKMKVASAENCRRNIIKYCGALSNSKIGNN